MKRTTMVEPGVAAVLGHVGAGQDADRRADEDADDGHDQAADDGVEQAAGAPGGGVISVKTASAEAAEALPEQRAEDEHEHAEARTRWRRATAPSMIDFARLRRRGCSW